MHEYVPIVFDENHFCVANIIIHSALLDFRFRSALHTEKRRGKQMTNLAAVLFPDKKGAAKSYVGAEETDNVYSGLV